MRMPDNLYTERLKNRFLTTPASQLFYPSPSPDLLQARSDPSQRCYEQEYFEKWKKAINQCPYALCGVFSDNSKI